MSEPDENQTKEEERHGLRDRISGFGQKVIGEIETLGGVLTGDPTTQAEGEFNVEVGELREDIEEDLKAPEANREDVENRS